MTIREIAATKIQMHCRGYLERRAHEREKAIIVVQHAWRTYAAQKKVEEQAEKHLLPDALVKQAIPFISLSRLSKLPRARDGRKPVFFLPGIHVVVKYCLTQEKCWEAFQEMNAARKACKDLERVCIPRARTYQEFLLVEEVRFSPYSKVAIGLYLEKPGCFTKAIEEFAPFYFKTTLPDLVDSERNPDAYRSVMDNRYDVMLGRYDNLALRLDKDDKGMIVPVDVEGFSPSAHEDDSPKKFINLITLFPLHRAVIVKAACSYNSELSIYFVYMNEHRHKVLHCFEKIYTRHLVFAQRKEISLHQPDRLDTFSDHVMHEVLLYLCGELEKDDDNDGPFEGCLKGDSLTQFKDKFFQPFATELHSLIETYLSKQVKRHEPIRSMQELLNARTLQFDLSAAVEDLHKRLPKLDIFDLDAHEEYGFLEHIVHLFFKGLVRYDHIAYANRYFGFKKYIKYCLFC